MPEYKHKASSGKVTRKVKWPLQKAYEGFNKSSPTLRSLLKEANKGEIQYAGDRASISSIQRDVLEGHHSIGDLKEAKQRAAKHSYDGMRPDMKKKIDKYFRTMDIKNIAKGVVKKVIRRGR